MGAHWKLSLRLRLVASISFIVLIAVTGFGVTGYRAATQAARAATLTRLQSVADQITQAGVPSSRERMAAFIRVATDPAVVRALTDSSPASQAAALAVLARLGPDTGTAVATELRDRNGIGRVRLSRPAPGSPLLRPDSATMTPLFLVGDTVLSGASAPVTGDSGRLLGHVYQVRRLGSSAGLRRQLDLLIGPQASLLAGNRDGSVWTDFVTVTAGPSVEATASEYSREGVVRLAARAPVASSPLILVVELPKAVALASAASLLRTFIAIGAAVLILGVAVAWLVARTITKPLATLTIASEQIASGGTELDGSLPVGRYDEIGGLARSFAAMARRVREGRETLETQVTARTRDLSTAVDQLHEAQEELVRKERLATLGQLSSSVGHELRNPLGVMTNAVYYLEATQRDAPAKVREYLGIIRDQIRISEKIVADLLDFARIRPPQRTARSLAGFVDEQLGRIAFPPPVTVARHLGDAAVTVFIDPIQIGQVLLNVFTNAAQAMEDTGGTLTIRARTDAGRVLLDVSDTGPGIEPANLEKVFEPLFTTKARGIGLGLSVSRALARANGGDLTAESTPGQGATFTLTMPTT